MANNIADLMDEHTLDTLGADLKQQVEDDIESRSEWLERNDRWMELVTQVMEDKNYPWPDASNIKFPLIATAAIQFHARAYPSLLGNNKPVKCRVVGRDKNNLKAERAYRVSTFMSYQVTDGMETWMEDMDRLLFLVPIIGSIYKKTYYSEQKQQNVSELIHPRDLIINYDALDIKDARKTHRLWKLPNTIKEMQLRGLYREFDEEEAQIDPPKTHSEPRDKAQGLTNPGKADDYSLQEIYEVHCLLDLDEDGYKEPYVCTIRESDGKVYRLVANYDDENMEYQGDKLVAIKSKDYFTHYFFLPDPESKTHGIGFGTMVGPINEAVNTIINQLTDSGHLHTLGGGFLSRGIRMKGGAVKFKPGEWKTVNATGDDLRKGIVPLPTKEPSSVLFQMLGMLIDAGKDLSSVQDLMVGRNPGQNQPYSTTQAVMEQGMKVFNGIYKRLYRSMTNEFKKLYRLNREHPDVATYMNVLDADGMDVEEAKSAPSLQPGPDGQPTPSGPPMGIEGVLQFLADDFKASDIDIVPTAEPDMVAEMEKMMKANSLMQHRANGVPLNVEAVTRRVLEAEGHENVQELMQAPPPQIPPEVQLEQQRFEHQKQMDGLKARLDQLRTEAEVQMMTMDAMLKMAQARKESTDGLHAQFIAQQKQTKDEFEAVTKRLKVLIDGKNNQQAGEQAEGSTGGSE
jgi:chaperonin GroES